MPLAMRPGPPSFSLAKTKIRSPLAMRLPPYIVFCSLNANAFAFGSLTSALIANILQSFAVLLDHPIRWDTRAIRHPSPGPL